jgi:hypothetical protein
MTTITVPRAVLEKAQEALIHMCHNTFADKGYDGQLVQDAIDGLKGALAQQGQEPIKHKLTEWGFCGACGHDKIPGESCARSDCPEKPVTHPPRRETEQEPVARVLQTVGRHHTGRFVAEVEAVRRLRIGEILYTAPPRREWQSLSEEEIAKVWCGAVMAQSTKEPGLGVIGFARAVDAALKEKNS